MHGSRELVHVLLEDIKNNIKYDAGIKAIVFPPAIFLPQTQEILHGSNIEWGAQNIAVELEGAYTGEISGPMLVEFGCRYVLVGHSERRLLFKENDEVIANKFATAQKVGLIPVLCVGETLEQHNAGLTEQVVTQQLQRVLARNNGVQALENAIIAYEPVWAIGTGLTASPDQAESVHAVLRKGIAEHSAKIADQVCILYGGSVKSANAKGLFTMPDIDGGLIGGASLQAPEFLRIYQAAT